jgi:hypothetical protein
VKTAYKFLARGATGTFTAFPWPAPGEWVDVEGELDICKRGIHVCRSSELAHWLHDELWQVEIEGEEIEGVDCLVVRRARLTHRIDAWTSGGAERFAAACIAHAEELLGATPPSPLRDLLADATLALQHGYVAIAAYSAALVVGRHGADVEASYDRERGWQSTWIMRELIDNPGV